MTGTCPVHPSVTLVEDTSYDVPREYCPRCESAEQNDTERQTTAPSGTDPLDFERQRDAESASWKRADPKAALIERRAWNTWLVTLPDSEDAHLVTLQRDHGALVGECVLAESGDQCPARKYNDSEEPCAHQCTVRKAAFGGLEDVYGDVVTIFAADDIGTARADYHIESAMADGGRRGGDR